MRPIIVVSEGIKHTEVLSTDYIVATSRKDNGFGIVAIYQDIPLSYSIYLRCGRWDINNGPYHSVQTLIERNNDRFEFFII